jgi:hypothetical protein
MNRGVSAFGTKIERGIINMAAIARVFRAENNIDILYLKTEDR